MCGVGVAAVMIASAGGLDDRMPPRTWVNPDVLSPVLRKTNRGRVLKEG